MIMFEMPPQNHGIQASTVINFFKGGMLPYLLTLMWYFDNYREEMCLYMCMHGSYGLLWLTRHYTQPDASFARQMTWSSAFIAAAAILIPYCVPAYLLASGACDKQLLSDWTLNGKVIVSVFWRKYLALFLYIMGVTLTTSADVQKNTHLKHVK